MAKFVMELPEDILKDFQKINSESEKILGEMTKAGAEVVMNNIKANAPASIKSSEMMNCLEMTKTYRTPSDGGINTKVGFYGYFKNKNGVETPAPLVANVFEFGKSGFRKKPFLRRSFRKAEIEKAMLDAQKRASGGLLE